MNNSVRTLNSLLAQERSIEQQLVGVTGPTGPSNPLLSGELLLSEQKVLPGEQTTVISFTGISQIYNHLKVKAYLRVNVPNDVQSGFNSYIGLNGATGSLLYCESYLYDITNLIGSTSDGGPTVDFRNTGCPVSFSSQNLGPDTITQFDVLVPSYSLTGIKQLIVKEFSTLTAGRSSGTKNFYYNGICFRDEPVTQVNFVVSPSFPPNLFTTGSTIQLYGLR